MTAGRTAWRKDALDLAKAGAMLRDYATPCEGDPIEAFVFRDRLMRHRRITARYAGGWSIKVNFTLGGKVSSCCLACSVKMEVRK